MKILVINCGSSSLKYQLIDMENEQYIAKGICERIGTAESQLELTTPDGAKHKKPIDMPDHTAAFYVVKEALLEGEFKVIDDLGEIAAIGHRVVQAGTYFNKSVFVTEDVVKKIDELSELAPLHNHAHAQGIYAAISVFGKDMPQVVVFDTAFHSTMPDYAYVYPIPYEYTEKYKIRRYGFHGTSHRFVSNRCAELMGLDSLEGIKLITCHIGAGASIAAIKDGKVIDTSMGLTPLDGFEMGSRCGSLDPSVVTYLQQKEGWTPAETDNILNKRSGVLGVSGISADDRNVKAAAAENNYRAKLARDIQWYQIKKTIGSYIAAMNGLDVVVFCGGLGENTEDLRKNVCDGLAYMGVKIDSDLNDKTVHGAEALISTPDSKVKVFVIPTNEELLIARDTRDLLLGLAE